MTDRRAIAILLGLHLAIVAIVQPRGDFPLNDDWAYAHSVEWLLAEGRFRLSDWVGNNLVPQALAGAAVTAVAGFSFEALRHLTQAVAVAAMAATYFWFRAARLEPSAALAAAAAIVAFPAWPVLANSYMTDLYGFALALAAAAFFLKALETTSRGALVLATAFSVAGVLERQVILVIPLAFLVASAWTRRPLNARAAATGAAPFAVAMAAEVAYELYLLHGPGLPSGQRMVQGRVAEMALKALTNTDGMTMWVLGNLAEICAYLGLFAIGWLAWQPGAATRRAVRWAFAGGLAIAVAAIALSWFPPYRAGYVIDRVGIGPLLLYDATRGLAPLDRSPGFLWPALALAGAFATAALATAIVTRIVEVVRRRREADPVMVFALAATFAYLGPLVLTDYGDRHLLYALPFLFVLWARSGAAEASGPRRSVAALWIAGAIVVSSVATRDYFAWNRARWDAIRMAERLGANADTIDGGFEYNADRRFEEHPWKSVPGKSWWFVTDDRYVVAFSPVPGYDVVETWKVPRWLPRSPAEVRLLRRKP